MAGFKYKGRVYHYYDNDMSNIIDQLNADPNGVKLTAQERFAVWMLVSGMKNNRELGVSTQSAWEKHKGVYGFLGDSAYKQKLDWKNPSNTATHLVFETGGSGVPSHNSVGWRYGRAKTGIIHDNSFTGLTLSLFITETDLTKTDVVDITSTWNGSASSNGGSMTLRPHVAFPLVMRGNGNITQIFWVDSMCATGMGSAVVSHSGSGDAIASTNSSLLPKAGAGGPTITPNNNQFILGESSPLASHSFSRKGFVGISNYLTVQESVIHSKLIFDYNSQLQRNPFRS